MGPGRTGLISQSRTGCYVIFLEPLPGAGCTEVEPAPHRLGGSGPGLLHLVFLINWSQFCCKTDGNDPLTLNAFRVLQLAFARAHYFSRISFKRFPPFLLFPSKRLYLLSVANANGFN